MIESQLRIFDHLKTFNFYHITHIMQCKAWIYFFQADKQGVAHSYQTCQNQSKVVNLSTWGCIITAGVINNNRKIKILFGICTLMVEKR